MEQAFDWLEKAHTPSIPHTHTHTHTQSQDPELWYARGVAALRVDQGMSEDDIHTHTHTDTDPQEWSEEVETETYGAKTGPEFVRVVRRRANKHKKARAKEGESSAQAHTHTDTDTDIQGLLLVKKKEGRRDRTYFTTVTYS